MADERPMPPDEPTPEPAPADPQDAPPVEPEPEPSVEDLKAELQDARHARDLYEQTLHALQAARTGPAEQPQSAPPPQYYDPPVQGVNLTRSQIDRIKAESGMTSDEDVAAAVRWARPILEELARPLVGYVAQLADIADRHEARLSVEGYAELADEIEKEVQAQRARGSHLPRKELAAIAKAKKLPAVLAKEAERKKADKAEQASARRAQGVDRGIQKIGPSAGGGGPRVSSIEQAKSLPTREDRIKALEALAGNRAG